MLTLLQAGGSRRNLHAGSGTSRSRPSGIKELLDRFLEITDRKVSVSDDYGDDKWDALPKEVVRLLSKAAKVDHDEIEPIKRTVRFLQQRAP
jgi:hypothetical protein